ARLPCVGGVDRFLPDASGRLHPTWRTPYVALLVQAFIAGLFVFLGQAGTSVRGAYDALVSMGIIAYFIPFLFMFASMSALQSAPARDALVSWGFISSSTPFLFMFASMIALQREPAGPDVMRVPGGKPVAIG